jgi:hypothetical protein
MFNLPFKKINMKTNKIVDPSLYYKLLSSGLQYINILLKVQISSLQGVLTHLNIILINVRAILY